MSEKEVQESWCNANRAYYFDCFSFLGLAIRSRELLRICTVDLIIVIRVVCGGPIDNFSTRRRPLNRSIWHTLLPTLTMSPRIMYSLSLRVSWKTIRLSQVLRQWQYVVHKPSVRGYFFFISKCDLLSPRRVWNLRRMLKRRAPPFYPPSRWSE